MGLVDNAARHGRGTITVRTRPRPHGVVIEVSDEGAGITSESDAIFTRRSDRQDRHGIGLALAKTLAEAEGARLRLDHAGPSPVFALYLPSGSGPDAH